MNVVYFIVFLDFGLNLACSFSLNDTKDLKKFLFTDMEYDKKTRPIHNRANTMYVDVKLNFSGVGALDEVQEILVSHGYLSILWTDEQLQWSPGDYGGLLDLVIPQDDVWKPDIVLKNGVEAFKELGGKVYYVYVTSDGTVSWNPYAVFETKCSVDLTYFPYDTQTCSLVFTIWSHKSYEISFTGGKLEFHDFEENSVWTIVSSSSKIQVLNEETSITYTFVLQRKPMFFMMNTALPVILLGFLNTFVFIVPADAGEKMGFSITVFLAFTVFLTILTSQIPKNSEYMSVMSVYVTGQLIQSVLIVLLSSIQLRLHHRPSEIPISRFYKSLIKCSVRRYRKQGRDKSKDSRISPVLALDGTMEQKEDHPDNDIEWKDVSHAIDQLAFKGFLLFVFLWTLICFAVIRVLG